MFSSNNAMWWSPSGRFLAFAEFNETDVHIIAYPWYGQGQYPEVHLISYPKVRARAPLILFNLKS